MAGSIGGAATSATWTSSVAGGSFAPNATTLNAVYTPPSGYTGNITMTLTTNDPAGACGPAIDQMIITINPPATVNAGSDQTICAGSTVTLAGTRGGSATSSTWTTSGTGTFNNASSLTAIYTPSAADITAGTVTLTLTTNDPTGPCTAVSDVMVITINPAATVNAGPDQGVCAGSTVTLAGTKGGSASSATWTTSGSGSFSPGMQLRNGNAVYTPSSYRYFGGYGNLDFNDERPEWSLSGCIRSNGNYHFCFTNGRCRQLTTKRFAGPSVTLAALLVVRLQAAPGRHPLQEAALTPMRLP